MYVIPTPFALLDGAAGYRTIILPEDVPVPSELQLVGELIRIEVEEVIVAYSFDLQTRELTTKTTVNPTAGREHRFRAYRVAGTQGPQVKLRQHWDAPERHVAPEHDDQQDSEP
jgi:hypothetical protein